MRAAAYLCINCAFDGPADGESALKESAVFVFRIASAICAIRFGMTAAL